MSAIRVELQLSDGSFTTGMLRAGQSLEQFNKQLRATHPNIATLNSDTDVIYKSMRRADQSTRTFLSTMRDVSIVVGAVSMGIHAAGQIMNGFVGSIIRTNAEFERMQKLMESMSTASDHVKDAADNVDYLIETSMRVPFQLQTMTNAFVKLKATGTDPLNGSLQAITDGVAAFGGTDDSLNRLVLGISQMSGKGVIQMEEMRQQLSETMPRAMELMARSMGMSMGELVKSIGTGRLETTNAMNAFLGEISRTFGGQAAEMMKTFDGQISQTATLLQKLALEVGKTGFFDTVKDQLKELNYFLASTQVSEFAEQLGVALGKVTNFVSGVVQWVIKARREIFEVGKTLVMAFAGSAVLGALSQFGRGMAAASMSLELFFGATTKAKLWAGLTNIENATKAIGASLASLRNFTFSGMIAGVGGLGGAFRSTAVAAGSLGLALAGAAATMSAALPWVALVGTGIHLVAQHFGLFVNKGENAIQTLKDFSATSREEMDKVVDDATKVAEGYERQAQAIEDFLSDPWELQKHVNRTQMPKSQIDSFVAGEIAKMQGLRKKADEILDVVGAGSEEYSQRAAVRLADLYMRDLEAEMASQKSLYDTQGKLRRDQHDANIEAVKQGLMTEHEAKDAARKAQHQAAVDDHKATLALIDQQQMELTQRLDETTDIDERAGLNLASERMVAMWIAAWDSLSALEENGPFGEVLVTALSKGANALEAAEKDAAKLGDTMGDLQSDAAGVSSAVGAMNRVIASGDYGGIEGGEAAFRALHAEVIASTAAVKEFEEVLDARKSVQQKLNEFIDKAQLDRWKAERLALGKTVTELDEMEWRYLRGDLGKGFGPSEEDSTAWTNFETTTEASKTAVEGLADQIQNRTFGPTTQSTLQTTTENVRALTSEVGLLGNALSNISFGNLDWQNMDLTSGGGAGLSGIRASNVNVSGDMKGRMAHAMQYFMSQNWSAEQAAGIVGNLAGESGLNPNSRNKGDGRDGSDSIGIAQWNSDRAARLKTFASDRGTDWNDFDTQLAYLQHELENREARAGGLLKSATSAEQASESFMRNFERPSDKSIRESGPKRAGYALQALGTVNGQTGQTPVAGMSTPVVSLDAASLRPFVDAVISPVDTILKKLTIEDTAPDVVLPTLEAVRTADAKTTAITQGTALEKFLTEQRQAIADQLKGIDTKGVGFNDLVGRIRDEEFGSNQNFNAPEYETMVALAKEYDATVKQIKDTEDARKDALKNTEDLKKQELELSREALYLHQQLANPANSSVDQGRFDKFADDLNEYVESYRIAFGAETDEYRDALARRSQLMSNFRSNEYMQDQIASAERTTSIQTSLMSETQQRQHALQMELAVLDAKIAAVDQSEAAGLALVEEYERQKAAIRQQYAEQANPMAAQMREWGDLQGNLTKQSTQWMSSVADGLTGVIMGTGDLKQAFQGIIKDILNSGIKAMMSSMMGGKGEGAKSLLGGSGGAKGAKAGLGKLVGVAHTGGVIGQSNLSNRRASALSFLGAPRFHTGGIVGGPRLLPSEVPIIAQKGEGVFTSEQMKALGGSVNSQSVQINAPVTVNASGGTKDQNADLAKQIGKTLEGQLRGMIVSEMRQASRPGNFANSRSM